MTNEAKHTNLDLIKQMPFVTVQQVVDFRNVCIVEIKQQADTIKELQQQRDWLIVRLAIELSNTDRTYSEALLLVKKAIAPIEAAS